jgi:ribosomal protein S12 methylthiotransferase
MKRPAFAEDTLERIAQWRRICPDITLRSTFIAGFPGETEAEFQELLDWQQAAQLDRVGCFTYSPVEGARANALPDHVPEDVQQDRLARFMKAQAKISRKKLKAKVGKTIEVLVDEIGEDHVVTGRSWADAPEIDGKVYLSCIDPLKPGQIVRAEVIGADEHDLNAEVIDE